MARVSVVMTVYNQSTYVAEAIESVLAQTYTDRELIVVDDGSTDDSAGVVERFGARLRLVRRKNGGLAAARNSGIERAHGEYVTFCDADDIHLPHRVAAQAHVLDRVPRAALVFSELSPYRGGRVVAENLLRDKVMGPMKRTFDEEISAAFSESSTCTEMQVPVPSQHADRRVWWGRVPELIALAHVAWGGASMYRRAALVAMGGHDESLRRYVDWELSSRLSKAYPIAFLDVPVLWYRLHEGQLTKKTSLGAQSYRQVIEQVWRADPIAYAQNREVIDRCLGSAHWSLGKVAEAEGDFGRAAQCFFASVRANPKQKMAYVDLAKAAVRRLSSLVGR